MAVTIPSVTVTSGVASAETGSVFKATFPVDTFAVNADKYVRIYAHAGAQTLHAGLDVRVARVETARLELISKCDGRKGKVSYTLTGPAAAGLTIKAHVTMEEPNGNIKIADGGETVPTGNSGGAFRIEMPTCRTQYSNQSCTIHGSVRIENNPGMVVTFGNMCSGV